MIKKKICLVGSFSVGKTSLVKRFISNSFSEKYLTTIGVKIEEKPITVNNDKVTLIVWDLHGDDMYQNIKSSYLRGSSGYLLVIDGTRPQTLKDALNLKERLHKELGEIPGILIVNKEDLKSEWKLSSDDFESIKNSGLEYIETSAKTGKEVEETFMNLTKQMLSNNS